MSSFWSQSDCLPVLHPCRIRPGLKEEPEGAMNERVVQSLAKVLKQEPSLWYLKVSPST